ncbi:choice-of-anchor J domain-containing protein [Flavobacterium rakeshii]|uniref:choice-of-anchor J domain-containing protein n=1 Tax=Flavobacterium rakeshii TaxID=1038845 RepID=UPI002E7AED9E|nr:choice-of-anchor J domain-containing protein [Flavobacterium rakeshii]MEE1898783.1 choice-of-anchor J domain-containing protein [Flavobacterium rakeshii]
MKKITLMSLMSLLSFYMFGQLPQEGFEGTWPPVGWTITDNEIGTEFSWEQSPYGSTIQPPYEGDYAAYMVSQNVSDGTPEDWLITPQFNVPLNPLLLFYSKMLQTGPSGTTVKVMISTAADPSDLNSYTLLEDWADNEINPNSDYAEVSVELPSTTIGQDVYIAFVRSGGTDRWLIDNVSVFQQCLVPQNLMVSDITATSALLTWDAAGVSEWEVEVVEVSQTVTGNGVTVTGTSQYSPTLNPGTAYKFFVKSVCDSGANESDWAGPFNFNSVSYGSTCEDPIAITPSDLPYSISGNTINNANGNFTGTPGSSCGTTVVYLNGYETIYSYTPDEDQVISINLTNINISYAGLFVYESCDDIGVECYAGAYNAAPMTDLNITDLSLTGGNTYFILIGRAYGQSVGYTMNIQEENCPKPQGLQLDSITTDSVAFSWQEAGTATGWQFAVQPSGSGFPSGNIEDSSVTNGSQGGLTPNTTYEIYVRSECGAGSGVYSSWLGPVNFNTACVSFNVPFFEGFNSDSASESCWTVVNANGDNLTWNLNTTYFMYEGNQAASLQKQWNSVNNDDWLISPSVELNGNQRLRYQSRVVSATYPTEMEILLSSSGTALPSFTTELLPQQTIANNVYQEKIIYLDDYTGAVNIAFHVPNVDTSSWTLFLDSIVIEDIPACPDPVDLSASDITDTTASLSWTPGYQETQWEIVVQEQDGGEPTGDGILIDDNTYLAENLVAATYYEYYVRAHCSDTDDSNWVGPFVFNTMVCNPVNMCNYTFDILATSGSGTFSKIYVHQNNILVGTINAFGLNNTGTVALCPDVPFTVTWSTTYWNIYTQEVTITNPFDEVVYNWVKDVTPIDTPFFEGFPVCTLELCPKPQLVQLTDQQQTTLTIDWLELADATQWEIYVVEEGEDAPTEDSEGIIVDEHPYTVEDLNPGTLYSVYVRSVCGGENGNSTWAAEQVYSTLISNDNCDTAIVLPVSESGYCDSPYHATLNLATASSQGSTCSDASFANDDVWFEFTATSASQIMYISNREGNNLNLTKVVYSGDCSDLQEVECIIGEPSTDPLFNFNVGINNNDILLEGLTVGETYKIRVFSNAATASNTRFDICIATPVNPILIDQDTYTAEELVTNVFASDNCAQITNVNTSTGTNYGAPHNGIGYFTQGSSNFPFEGGIILSTGKAETATGPKVTTQSYNFYDQVNNTEAWLGDQDLLDYMIASGVDDNIIDYYDATLIEFDFMPFGSELNFNFLFSSEDYGKFQCEWADAFAFLLTDEDGNTTNLAVVPNTTTPISVVTVRDEQYNADCDSQNPEYFDRVYDGFRGDSRYGSNNNFYGNTVPLSVNATVEPGHQYHIKMVIAEKNDGNFDSAIFLDGSSFDTGSLSLGDDLLVSTNNALCSEATTVLDTHLDEEYFDFEWSKDGDVIDSATGASYTVTEAGDYSVTAIYTASGCTTSAAITVEYYNNEVVEPQDIETCSLTNEGLFDLTQNAAVVLENANATDYEISYYTTEEDASTGDDLTAIQDAANYTSVAATVYVRAYNTVTGCAVVYPFELTVLPSVTAVIEFSYTDTICAIGDAEFSPVLAEGFQTGGSFTSNDAGLVIDAESGIIDVVNSQVGSYEITYTLASFDCTAGGTYTETVVISAPATPVTEFTYADACIFSENTLPVLAEGFTAGGMFSSTEITVDAQNGEVSLENVAPGIYNVEYTVNANSTDCIAEGTYTAQIVVTDLIAPQIAFEYETPYCADNGVISPLLSGGFAQGGLFTAEAGLVLDPENGSIDVEATQPGTYTVIYEYVNPETCEQGSSEAEITVLPAVVADVQQGCDNNVYVLSVSDVNGSFDIADSEINWTGPEGFVAFGASVEIEAEGTYTVEVITVQGCVITRIVEVNATACLIPRGISPNGDTMNDSFDLTGFGVTKISIFNRYGKEVFSQGTYNNEWFGQDKKGNELPTGTYYYAIELGNGDSKTGWVYINRED